MAQSTSTNNQTSLGFGLSDAGCPPVAAELLTTFVAGGASGGAALTKMQTAALACQLKAVLAQAASGNTSAAAVLSTMYAAWRKAYQVQVWHVDQRPEGMPARYATWLSTLKTCVTINSNLSSQFWVGLNAYSDMTFDEFASTVLMNPADNATTSSKGNNSPAAAAAASKAAVPETASVPASGTASLPKPVSNVTSTSSNSKTSSGALSSSTNTTAMAPAAAPAPASTSTPAPAPTSTPAAASKAAASSPATTATSIPAASTKSATGAAASSTTPAANKAASRSLLASCKGCTAGATAPAYPPSINWLTAGKVLPLAGFQAQCGSSYAFASAAAIESQYLISRNATTMDALSPQQIMDCSAPTLAAACKGGVVTDAFQFASQSGVVTDSAYRYRPSAGGADVAATGVQQCNRGFATGQAAKSAVARITGTPAYKQVPARNKLALIQALAVQPAVTYITVDPTFQHYAGGIWSSSSCSGTTAQQALLVVGYSIERAGQEYWLAKNSLGSGWGERGFARIAMAGDGDGMCGMYVSAFQPGTVTLSAAAKPGTANKAA